MEARTSVKAVHSIRSITKNVKFTCKRCVSTRANIQRKKFFLKIQIYREEAVFDFSQPTPNVDNVVLKLNDGVVNVCRKVSLLFF